MRTRYGVSPWTHRFPDSRRPEFPRAKGLIDVPVVIIGGGLTGCATAYACAAAGVRAVVLEASLVGRGASGRSAGLLLPDPGPAFRDLSQAHGLRAARTAFQSWRHASLDAGALLRRLGIRCHLDRQDALIVGTKDDETRLRRELQARSAAGLGATWLARTPLHAAAGLDDAGAIKMRDAFVLDPYRACVGLASAAAARGARIHERAVVRKVRVGRKRVDVIVEGATIQAETVVVTTGAAMPEEYRQLRRHFKTRESYLVLTGAMPAYMRRALGTRGATIADTRSPSHRIRFTGDDRILVSGADQPPPARKRDTVLIQRTGQLMYELLTMYPAITGLMPEYGWALPYADTADGLPYIGPHRNFPRHLFALGRGGDSVTGAFLAARILARHLQGAPDRADEVFGWTR